MMLRMAQRFAAQASFKLLDVFGLRDDRNLTINKV
jgi:hypothetical protein